jgi:hypothetical protein
MIKHRGQLNKRPRIYMDRQIDAIPVNQSFLIVCEGTKTEPQYFRQFKASGLVIQVEGTARNTISLVQEALKFREEDEYTQVWCVFDKDDFPRRNFERAIQMAADNGMKVAYSNQAFEVWYVLHYCYMHNAIRRKAYMKMLDRFLGFKYEKNDPKMYAALSDKIDTAIKNAERLLEEHGPIKPGLADPSTRVHELVIELRKYTKRITER